MDRPSSDRRVRAARGWAAQAEAYDVACQEQNDRAARVVAGQATSAVDCRELLEMLGIEAGSHRRA